MKPLLILRDKDIYPDVVVPKNTEYRLRRAVKMVIFDNDKKIALVGKVHRLLPGGGVEEGETLEQAAKRESLEEVGCNIEIDKEFAMTEEYRVRNNRYQQTHFFIAHLIGEKCEPQTTQADEQGIQVDWHSLDEAIALFERQIIEVPLESYHGQFNVRTHIAVLKELQKQILS